MKRTNEELNEKLNTVYKEAKGEERVSAESLLQEIEPLIREYFIGEVILENNEIKINLLNGQKFKMTLNEIK